MYTILKVDSEPLPSSVATCVRDHVKPRLMGVAPSILSRWYIGVITPHINYYRAVFSGIFLCIQDPPDALGSLWLTIRSTWDTKFLKDPYSTTRIQQPGYIYIYGIQQPCGINI